MKTTVYVLKSQSKRGHRYLEALVEVGFSVVEVHEQDATETLAQVQTGDIVFLRDYRESWAWQKVEDLWDRPDVGFIYILPQDHQKELTVPIYWNHKILRPLLSFDRFVLKIQEVESWLAQVSVHDAIPTHEGGINEIEPQSFFKALFGKIQKSLPGVECSWLMPDEMDYLCHLTKREYERVESSRYVHHEAFITTDLNHRSQIHSCLSQYNKKLHRETKKKLIVDLKTGDGHFYIFSYGDKDFREMGHLVISGAKLEQNQLDQIHGHVEEERKSLLHTLKYWKAVNESYMDPLTGLYNQRFLSKALSVEITRSEKTREKFCVLFLDIDKFKQVNDQNGHLVGSELLTQIGRTMRGSVRSCDLCFRYGGDEFVVILVDVDLDQGQLIAQRIRKKIEKMSFVVDGVNIKLTMSIGVANYPQSAKSTEELLYLADQAMYQGKNRGRNKVYLAS